MKLLIRCYYYLLICLVTPVIILEVIHQTQNEGDNISFTCYFTGEPVSNISWYFNGGPINEANIRKYTTSMMSLNATTFSNTLTIMSVESSDVGTYICNATNVVSSSTASGILTVNGEIY